MKYRDIFLIVIWAFFLFFAGPFLFSARDWLLVGLGLFTCLLLVHITIVRVRSIIYDEV